MHQCKFCCQHGKTIDIAFEAPCLTAPGTKYRMSCIQRNGDKLYKNKNNKTRRAQAVPKSFAVVPASQYGTTAICSPSVARSSRTCFRDQHARLLQLLGATQPQSSAQLSRYDRLPPRRRKRDIKLSLLARTSVAV